MMAPLCFETPSVTPELKNVKMHRFGVFRGMPHEQPQRVTSGGSGIDAPRCFVARNAIKHYASPLMLLPRGSKVRRKHAFLVCNV